MNPNPGGFFLYSLREHNDLLFFFIYELLDRNNFENIYIICHKVAAKKLNKETTLIYQPFYLHRQLTVCSLILK